MSKDNGKAKAVKQSTRTPWTQADGKRLRKTRKDLGFSQAQLGLAVGVTSSRICEIERVDFPGGRHCSPGKALGENIANEFAKRARADAKKAERVAAKTAKAPKTEAKVETKPEAMVTVA